MTFTYLDTETTGLDPHRHQIWEIAYAVNDGPIRAAVVPHSLVSADPDALEIGQYERRSTVSATAPNPHLFEDEMLSALDGRTLVGANPAFDAAFLRARWGVTPWYHRLLDVEAYAMPHFGWVKPRGLKDVADGLREDGFTIPLPDHTAAGDVATVRACHLALQEIYGGAK